MAYFLKRSNIKKGTYLQIYESFYDPKRKQTAHRAVRPIGYVHELEERGIADPVPYFKAEVEAMNAERKAEKEAERTRKITDETPEKLLGYFPLKAVDDALRCKEDIDMLQLAAGFKFSLWDLLSSLVYARAVAPCSKSRTFHDVLPQLGIGVRFSLDQLYDGLAFLGREYQKVVEIYNAHIAEAFPRNLSRAYFDCTNFYFEIDREHGLCKKGPSKENRKGPIVGMGLLLDADLVPIGLDVFPGNESEKPVLRESVARAKRKCGLEGTHTVRVADKGLNCADNVADAVLAKDGYIFSRSVKTLPGPERAWVLCEEGWSDVAAPDGTLRYRTKSCTGEFSYSVTCKDGEAKKRSVRLAEKRVATYNPALARKQRAEIDRQVEKARKLRLSQARRGEYGDSAKFVSFAAVDGEGEVGDDTRVVATLNHEAIEKARALAGYNMLVTSETGMPDDEVYSAYHELWRIEESFKVMKSELDARPVYLQRDDAVTGHFLVCYLAVTLLRILQFKALDNRFCSEEIMRYVRGFKAVESSKTKYLNISRKSALGDELERLTSLPVNDYYLTGTQVRKIVGYRFKLEALKGATALPS